MHSSNPETLVAQSVAAHHRLGAMASALTVLYDLVSQIAEADPNASLSQVRADSFASYLSLFADGVQDYHANGIYIEAPSGKALRRRTPRAKKSGGAS